MNNFQKCSQIFKMEATEDIKTHIVTDYVSCIEPIKETTTVELMANHINCKTTGKCWNTET